MRPCYEKRRSHRRHGVPQQERPISDNLAGNFTTALEQKTPHSICTTALLTSTQKFTQTHTTTLALTTTHTRTMPQTHRLTRCRGRSKGTPHPSSHTGDDTTLFRWLWIPCKQPLQYHIARKPWLAMHSQLQNADPNDHWTGNTAE